MSKVQGKSIHRVIGVMDTNSRMLASLYNAYVMVTRQISELSLHTDDKAELAQQIKAHEGGVAHALDVVESGKAPDDAQTDLRIQQGLELTSEENVRVERDSDRLARSIIGIGAVVKGAIDKLTAKPEPVQSRAIEREEPEREPTRDRSYDWGIGD